MNQISKSAGTPARGGLSIADPLVALGEQYREINRACMTLAEHGDDATYDAANKRWKASLREIAKTRATSPAGALVKAEILAVDLVDGATEHSHTIARSLIADLKRMAGL